MLIDPDILVTYGGAARKYDKGAIIFWEGGMPVFYYQLVAGDVRVFSTNDDGKCIVQGIFTAGDSFGEPPLLVGKPYPSSAQALSPCVVMRISKDRFLGILADYPEIAGNLLSKFAERIYNKASAVQIWVNQSPEEKILVFLAKKKSDQKARALVPYTRQQIADFTGLRVETVIRTLIRMSTEGKVEIVGHKVYY